MGGSFRHAFAAVTVLVAAWVGAAPAASPVSAAEPASEEAQCVVHVVGREESGELRLSEPRCYPTLAQAMVSEGVQAWGPGASERVIAGASFTIGYHCDGLNLVAPCTSVVGDDCGGGWLNTVTAWDNRISSTLNGCPNITHFDSPNRMGATEVTSGLSGHNLTSLDNRTESLQYS